MKNLRLISCLLVAWILIAMLSGCGSAGKQTIQFDHFTALQVGSFDTIDGGTHISEYPIWSPEKLNYHQDSSAAQSATVTFNGSTYSGTYRKTAAHIPNTYVSHQYKGDGIYFEINATTGELSSISFIYEPAAKATLDKAACKKIADNIADDYIVLSDYTVDTSTGQISNNTLYTFTYYREVAGYKTSDSLTISIDGNGNVSSFGVRMLNAFDNVKKVVLNEDNAKAAIETKLNAIYQNVQTRKGYDVKDVTLVKLADGSCAFLYTVNNQFESGDVQHSTQVRLLLK